MSIRKLCCNEALRTSTDGVPSLSAVVLLNSPANGPWEYKEYLRLLLSYRLGEPAGPHTKGRAGRAPPTSVFFICADGAYERLYTYYVDHGVAALLQGTPWAQQDGAPARIQSLLDTYGLCDVTIGDMDSSHVGDGSPADRHMTTTELFPLVDAISDEVLTRVLCRIAHLDAAVDSGEPPATREEAEGLLPCRIPVSCQMTTDFTKCILLLQRLRARVTADAAPHSHPHQGDGPPLGEEPWVTFCEGVIRKEEAAFAARVAAADAKDKEGVEDPARLEAERCRTLLHATSGGRAAPLYVHTREEAMAAGCGIGSPTAPSRVGQVCTVLLPHVAVLGAFGGRLDHELGNLCCVLHFATSFHLMLTDAANIAFACWPEGITQWVTPRAWAAIADEKCHCGVITMGSVQQAETTGLWFDIVKGRPHRYDGVTHTEDLEFGFDNLISSCNKFLRPVVTVDLRGGVTDKDATLVSWPTGKEDVLLPKTAPTVITCERWWTD